MNELYQPLSEQRNEIRLLTILPRSHLEKFVRCKLETKSLHDLTPEYQAFLSNPSISRLNKRQAISQWVQRGIAPKLSTTAPIKRIHATQPPTSDHRFVWGDYAALSYVWGDESNTAIIILNGKVKRVTSNLEKALQAFCSQGEFKASFKLWVDAICINQDDLDERGRQIQKMREIYGSAWSVVAWLGVQENRSDFAIQMISDLAVFNQAGCGEWLEKQLLEQADYLGSGFWLALQQFMERPYWYRLWIIQEMVMGASTTWIRCGTSSIDWTTFSTGIAFLEEHLWIVKDELLERDILLSGLEKDPRWITSTIHLVYRDLSALSKREETGGEYLELSRLLRIANAAMCKNPKDKIYGLVGLMSPHISQHLIADYALTSQKLYASTAQTFITTLDNLEPIREGNTWGPTNAPSWAADWRWESRPSWSLGETRLWGPSWLSSQSASGRKSYSPYCASLDTKHDTEFSDDGLLLACSGFVVDSVSGLSARNEGYFDWFEKSIIQAEQWNSVYGNHEETSNALYRTLLLDRVKDGEKASNRHSAILHLPSTFESARKQFARLGWNWLSRQEWYYFRWEEFRSINANFRLRDERLAEFFTDTVPPDASEDDFTEVYCCFDRTSIGRIFMLTAKGYMGWAPDNTFGTDIDQVRQGDMVAILFGCSTPIIIRPSGPHFQVLGDAYVHGLMDGEAMDMLQAGTFKTQQFTFC
jgi:hypothetical protein